MRRNVHAGPYRGGRTPEFDEPHGAPPVGTEYFKQFDHALVGAARLAGQRE